VTSGAQALLAAEADSPDLILLDITMPDMDGYEVCQRLRAQAASRDVPVIFLTALNDTADKVKGFDIGGVDYVTKPFQVEEVLARVKTHVALRQAQVALAESYAHLRMLEQLRDNLVQMIVHDMRSPLTALLLRLRFLGNPPATLGEEQAEDLRAAIQSAQALTRMTDDLLDVSRLEEGRMPVERSVWDLTRMARDVCAALAAMDRERSIDSAWASRSASSPSRPREGPSAWIRVSRSAARSGSSCRRELNCLTPPRPPGPAWRTS
jgi:CheY-like chemotaxis protein